LRLALLVLGGITALGNLTGTPNMLLVRRVVHRRLALLHFFEGLLTTVVALVLAYRGVELWALLAVDLTAVLTRLAFYYGWRPVWRPRLRWSPGVARYMLSFGSRSMLANVLVGAIDRADNLRSEERRVGKEWRARWSAQRQKRTQAETREEAG